VIKSSLIFENLITTPEQYYFSNTIRNTIPGYGVYHSITECALSIALASPYLPDGTLIFSSSVQK
jgi:hypothetical protein